MMHTNGGWITTREAADYLGIIRQGVRYLYLKGKLHRRFPESRKRNTTAYYSWEEVMQMRATTARVKRRFCIHWLPEHWQCDDWITIREAAEIISIGYRRVQVLIRRRFFVFRSNEKVGTGRRYLLSRLQIEEYRDDKGRQRRSAVMKTARVFKLRPLLTESEEVVFEHKKWLTIPEAALCLGVSVTSVYGYCTRRRLRRYPVGVKHGFCQRWWIDYADVKRLREDQKYQEKRARWRASIAGLPIPSLIPSAPFSQKQEKGELVSVPG